MINLGDVKRVFAVFAATLAVVAGLAYTGYRSERARPGSPVYARAQGRVHRLTAEWPGKPRSVVKLMIERYGLPDRASKEAVTWGRHRPWKRIIVHRDTPDSPLEQVVDYYLPPQRIQPVLDLDHGLRLFPVSGELSARSDREELNFLAINLADEVARERREPGEARQVYERTASLSASGKTSMYLLGLMFEPHWPEPPMREYHEPFY